MNSNPNNLLIFLIACILAGSGPLPEAWSAAKTVRVDVVHDGPSPLTEPFVRQLRREAEKLLPRDTEVRFHTQIPRTGQWDRASVQHALHSSLADSKTDMVVTSGPLGSWLAAHTPSPLPKPVLGLLYAEPSLFGLGFPEGEGTRITNLNLLSIQQMVQNDFAALRRLAPAGTLLVVMDAAYLQSLPGLAKGIRERARSLGLTPILRPVQADPAKALPQQSIPEDTAVYLGPTPRLTEKKRFALIRNSTMRRWPVFSAYGRNDVLQGALGAHTGFNLTRLTRHLALNIQAVLRGNSPEKLPVRLVSETRLCVNAATAQRLGLAIDQAADHATEILHTGPERSRPRLSLQQALNLAANHHPRLQERSAEVQRAESRAGQSKAAFFPQASGYWQNIHRDKDRSAASLGMQPWQQTTVGVRLEQHIFNDPLFTRFAAANQEAQAQKWEKTRTRLDITAQAGQAFFNYLRAQTDLQSAQKTHSLTLDHLQLARSRHRSGASGSQDVYRWETQEATQQSAVFRARTRLEQARLRLNEALGQPLQTQWEPAEPSLGGAPHFLRPLFCNGYATAGGMAALREQAERTALRQSPGLQALNALLQGARLTREQKKRAFFTPEVTASFEFEHELSRQSTTWQAPPQLGVRIPESNADNWTLALRASLPLFSGGKRGYAVAEAQAEITRLSAKRQRLRHAIRENVRSAVSTVQNTRPQIRLHRRAAQRAEQNLQIVQDQYAQGEVCIVDILDAQQQAIEQEKHVDLSRYAYFEALLQLQHSMSWFAWLAPPSQQTHWVNRLQHNNATTFNFDCKPP